MAGTAVIDECREVAAGAGERAGWRYDSRAVLGGELAVPCTCNPLQQG